MKNKLFNKFTTHLKKLGWKVFKTNAVGKDGECCTIFSSNNSTENHDEIYIWHINNKILGVDKYTESICFY